MVSIPSLWLPILLAAVFVFVGSSVIHMLLSYHKNDFAQVPDEDAVMDALRPFGIPAGDYVIPWAGGSEHLKSEAFKAKVEKGPVAVMTVYRPGDFFNMGPQLTQWFVYCIVVAIFAAYVGTRTLGAGGKAYVPRDRYSLTMSFCVVPASFSRSAPCSSATVT